MGAVGRALARLLSGFEARLSYHDTRRMSPGEEAALGASRLEIRELVATSDYVAAILPLNPTTRHFFDATLLGAMRPGAFLVNTGRGSTVDEEAVARALEEGRLGGYAADVFELEDWARADRPRTIPESLLACPDKTLFTSHIGSAVDRVRRDIAMEAARGILRALAGERPGGAVNEPWFDRHIGWCRP
jgi:phosphonate dehydrogenase